ncbi:uncharacterized protein FIBRA_05663 [Fibroporia radiculosa]|uniref:Large ribosomal subunit protein uL29m n=1 Tax=Fibroporia radiculosa TaxID=599839 RepID=J4H3N0_9APHY|nr:uncharacterized protein FIBRA_05663 [Fibroporia radiculosa]CCM03529.1 predicted protein [Fibroporia radiculosa]
MLSSARTFALQPLWILRARNGLRAFATHATTPTSTPASTSLTSGNTVIASASTAVDGPLRPHLNIPVDPNHGLWAFFRRKEVDGKVSHETLEPADIVNDNSGRSWKAVELRRKSFKDLHTLWYVLMRERNLLVTQNEEARRHKIPLEMLATQNKLLRCRKSMARIKYVINERRLAYEKATQAYNKQREADLAGEQKLIQAEQEENVAKAEAMAKAQEAARRKEAGETQTAARLAGAGIFETVGSESSVLRTEDLKNKS